MYLPGSNDRGRLAYLTAPATWPGGARRIACRVSYGTTRYADGVYHVWCVITATRDPRKSRGERFFVPEHMITLRD